MQSFGSIHISFEDIGFGPQKYRILKEATGCIISRIQGDVVRLEQVDGIPGLLIRSAVGLERNRYQGE